MNSSKLRILSISVQTNKQNPCKHSLSPYCFVKFQINTTKIYMLSLSTNKQKVRTIHENLIVQKENSLYQMILFFFFIKKIDEKLHCRVPSLTISIILYQPASLPRGKPLQRKPSYDLLLRCDQNFLIPEQITNIIRTKQMALQYTILH